MAKLWAAIVTPYEQVVRSEVDMVMAPSAQGEIGVLPSHQPLLAHLQEGPVTLRAGNQTDLYAISGGFIEVDRDKVTILAETAEPAAAIDTSRAEAALREAQQKLGELDPLGDAYAEQQSRIRRARARLQVAEQSRG